MNYKELKEGEIYFCDYYNDKKYEYIMRANKTMRGCNHIRRRDRNYWPSGSFNENESVYREATPEEKEHFLQCEQAGKYVEYTPLQYQIY